MVAALVMHGLFIPYAITFLATIAGEYLAIIVDFLILGIRRSVAVVIVEGVFFVIEITYGCSAQCASLRWGEQPPLTYS